MDPSHFGLSGHPFGHDGESANGSVAEAYGALLSELRAGLQAPQGITLLIGEQGSGKSTLSRSLVSRLSDKARVVYLPYAGPGLRHLLCESLEQLGVSVKDKDEGPLVEALRELASKRAQNEKATVIIVDEAQDLPAKTLERLAKVFGDDPAEPTMLHMILVGRPELLDRMNAASDRSILKQLVQVCRMDPIEPDDAFDYIRKRIGQAGGLAEDIFTEEAMKSIVQRAAGVPRKLDSICSAVLEVVDEQQGGEIPIQPEAVDLACRSMEGFELEPGDKQSAKEPDVSHVIEEVSVGDAAVGETGGFTADFGESDSFEDGTRENRRRLGLWAVGFLAVIAGLAAALTSRQGDDVNQLTVKVPVDSARPAQGAANTAEATRQMSAVAVQRQASVNQTAVGAVPKLKIQRNNASDALRSRRATFGKQPAPAAPAVKPTAPPARPTPAPSNQVRTPVRSSTAANAARPSTRREPSVKPAAVAARPSVVRPNRPPVASSGSSPTNSAAAVTAIPKATKPPSRPVATQRGQQKPAPPVPLPAASAAAIATPPALQPSQAKPVVAAVSRPVATAAAPAVPNAAPTPAVASKPVATPGSTGASDRRGALAGASSSHFAIQLGAFSTAANAEAYRKKAAVALSGVVVKQVESGGRSLFRVMVGRYASIDEARIAEAGIKQKGFSTFVRRVSR